MALHPSQAPNTSLALAESNTGRIPDVYKKKKENRQLRSIFFPVEFTDCSVEKMQN